MKLEIKSDIIEVNGELTQLELSTEIKDEITIKLVPDGNGNPKLEISPNSI